MKISILLRAAALMALMAGAAWLLLFNGLLTAPADTITPNNGSFQEVFWEERPLDLALQACLIIAGALGVAALLPAEDEE
jgi:hypothetical protein